MDGQELYNLYEAYMDVVENQQLDEEEKDKTGYGIDVYASKAYLGDKEKQEKLIRRMNRLKTKKEQMEVYDEAYTRFPYKKVEDKIHKKEADNPTGRGTPQSVKMDTVLRHFQGDVRRTEKREHSPKISKTKAAKNKARATQKEQIDIYDIILSHLLDEGYAETLEAAEAIIVNMSEEWRDSILG